MVVGQWMAGWLDGWMSDGWMDGWSMIEKGDNKRMDDRWDQWKSCTAKPKCKPHQQQQQQTNNCVLHDL